MTDGARDGHTGSVTAGLKLLAGEGRGGMITVPADIPAATSAEIDRVVAAHRAAPSFTISPAHDDLGSNAVICSPPDSVPLRFGENSYFPHLEAARRCGIEPTVIRQPGIAMDIDHPVDLAAFLRLPQSAGTRTRAFLEEAGIPKLLADTKDRLARACGPRASRPDQTRPHPEERSAGPRLEGWEPVVLLPILRDAVLRAAPQDEVGFDLSHERAGGSRSGRS